MNCKQALFFLIVAFLYIKPTHAQADSTKLLYSNKFESQFFVQAEGIFMQSLDNAAGGSKFSLNWLVNHKYYVGATYFMLGSNENVAPFLENTSATSQIDIKHMAAGLQFGYILFDKKIVSLNPELGLMWANAVFEYPKTSIKRANFGMLYPSVNAVFNTSKFIRFGLGVSYRANVGSINMEGLQTKNLNGVGGSLFVRIGSF